MFQTMLFTGWLLAVALIVLGWQSLRRREAAWQRLAAGATLAEPGMGSAFAGRRLRRRWFLAPPLLAIVTVALVWLAREPRLPYLVAIGLLVGLLARQLEVFAAERVVGQLESQLAEAIDIMIGAVGAGASVNGALDAALAEARLPLRPYLEELAGRIRLGDDPAEVFRSLAERVPLETFLLFTSALSVHWEVGGRLTSTLTVVGRTIRDRLETSRRIRSNTAQSQLSTLAVLGLTYFIAAIVWRNSPQQMADFVTSTVGSWLIAVSVVLQAAGITWMNLISKPRF